MYIVWAWEKSCQKIGYRMPKETAEKWLEENILDVREGKVPSKKHYIGKGVRAKDDFGAISIVYKALRH